MISAEREARRSAGPATRRFAILATMIVGIVGLAFFHAAPARTAGDCSVASAPLIASGTAQTSDPNACPDGRQYSALNLEIGDTLDVTVTPGTGARLAFAAYGPDVPTTGRALCERSFTFADSLSCLIPAAGRYVLVTSGSGSFTPVVKAAPAQADRVAGACNPATAPVIRTPVTQYANSSLCQQPGTPQYWRIDLRPGDKLSVTISPFNLYGGSISLRVSGPNSGTTGSPLCAHRYSGPGQMNCPMRGSGRYVLATMDAGSFTALVTHPTHTVATAASSSVTQGGTIRLSVFIGSNTAYPTGTCVVEDSPAWTWEAILRVHTTTTGTCSARLPATDRGTHGFRVRFEGSRGWASSMSKLVVVHVL